jgi:hypothetical protein
VEVDRGEREAVAFRREGESHILKMLSGVSLSIKSMAAELASRIV